MKQRQKRKCPNPLCGSDNLCYINVTGYTDLICCDCGQTIEEDVFNDGEWENEHFKDEGEQC